MEQVNQNDLNTPDYWDNVYIHERGSAKRRIDNDRLSYLIDQMRDYHQYVPHIQAPTLLDVGCGNGELLNLVHTYLPQWEKWGIDITPRTIDMAAQDFPKFKLQVGNIYELPYAPDTFDIVFCGETIEHLFKPEDAIAQLFRVVKPGGYVVISLPNEHANYSPEHIHEFTVGECVGMSSKHGSVFYDRLRVVCGGISIIWTTKK